MSKVGMRDSGDGGAGALDHDPVLAAFERAPMGPADPPEVAEAIRQGRELGFVSSRAVSDEIQERAPWAGASGK